MTERAEAVADHVAQLIAEVKALREKKRHYQRRLGDTIKQRDDALALLLRVKKGASNIVLKTCYDHPNAVYSWVRGTDEEITAALKGEPTP